MIRNKTLRTLGLYPAGFSRSASGAAASFRTDAAAPLRSLFVSIDPVQSGSGDPSPENVRPISGWDAVNIYRESSYTPDVDPYQTITIPYPPGTIYGATMDVLAGVLTVTIGEPVLLDGVINKVNALGSSGTNRYFRADNIRAPYDSKILICDKFLKKQITSTTTDPGVGIVLPSSLERFSIAFRPPSDAGVASVNTCNEYLASIGGIELCYSIEPITYQLDPITVQTLLGQNNIWSDAGDVALSYREGGVGSRSWMLALLAGRRDA